MDPGVGSTNPYPLTRTLTPRPLYVKTNPNAHVVTLSKIHEGAWALQKPGFLEGNSAPPNPNPLAKVGRKVEFPWQSPRGQVSIPLGI